MRMRRGLVLAGLCMVAAAGIADARVVRPRPPPPPHDKPPADKPAPKSDSYWEPLVTAGRRFQLRPDKPTDPDTYIVVEVYEARVVKGAKVARLRWMTYSNGAGLPMGNSLPSQIALTTKGAYLLTDKQDDKAVEKALKGAPTYPDPPRAFVHDDGYVRKDGDNICIGVGTPPSQKCEAGICHAEYCLAKGDGLVSIGGNYTPSGGDYKRPRPGTVPPELQTGIPECDLVFSSFYECFMQSPQFDPEQRRQMIEQFAQLATQYRQAAQSGQRADYVTQCISMGQQFDSYRQSLGCGP
jgi:hypothetical protein